jgi:hypothetical protein
LKAQSPRIYQTFVMQNDSAFIRHSLHKRVLQQIERVTLAESKVEKRAVIKFYCFYVVAETYFIMRPHHGADRFGFYVPFHMVVGTIDAVTGMFHICK